MMRKINIISYHKREKSLFYDAKTGEGMSFIGRKKEMEVLERLRQKKTSSLAVVWGRRRIGKSRLVEEFLKGKKSWSFSGAPPMEGKTGQEEINYFVKQVSKNTGMPALKAGDWVDALWLLGSLAQKEDDLVIFFDEISWMGSKDPNFLGYLKTEWDRTLSKCPNLILILCGSISSWIEENIINSTGFYGRVSLKLRVEELPLSDCNRFWSDQKNRVSSFEKFKVLGVTGGVPKYLEEVIPEESAEKNITHLCFRKEGILYQEYRQIFSDLFARREGTFDKIIRTLSDGAKSIDDICSALKIKKSGNISKYLQELVSVGFVSEDRTWNIKSNKSSTLKLFRLKDNYIRFYLKFIEPNSSKVEQGAFSLDSIRGLPGWESVMGLQFENLVVNNIIRLCSALGISMQDVERSGPFFQKSSKKKQGCQIDLLIQAKFGTIYLCEVKFRRNEVGCGVIREVEEKVNRLSIPKGYTIRPVLIHVNGVAPKVRESSLFDKILDFSDFLRER